MLFHSLEYFFLLVFGAFWFFVTPQRWRWALLLAVSYLFYGSNQLEFIWLLWVSTLIDYGCGFALFTTENPRKRKALLACSVLTNLSLLGYFKYRAFVFENMNWLFGNEAFLGGPAAQFVLPIGISFFTLQSMGYTIDVYYRRAVPERHLGYFALYVAYFPQLIAGPIERGKRLLPQLKAEHFFDWTRIRLAGALIAVGLFKKLVIVGSLTPLMQGVFESEEAYSDLTVVLAVSLSLFYIYMDFSAYTDIARGSARIFGVELTENFRRPMGATTIRDFWRRWHISLTRWILDYLHRPFAGRSRNRIWRYFATLVTFTVVGLWHGANYTFVLFGFCHGVLSVLETMCARAHLTWPKGPWWDRLRNFRTILLVNLTCVLFFSPSIDHALVIYAQLFSLTDAFSVTFKLSKWQFFIALLASLGWICGRYWINRKYENGYSLPKSLYWRWATYLVSFLVIASLAAPDQNAFIYFRF